MKIAIVINAKRLTPELDKLLKDKNNFTKYNLDYDVYIAEPTDIPTILEKIKTQSYNTFLIAGGDGTVRAAIQELIDTEASIAILPLGTFNLLAKSLNYPSEIDAVFNMLKNNKTKKIDLMQVNEHVVINHAWIGFYFYMLKMRKKHQSVIGKSKFLKIIFNAFNLFKVFPIYNLQFKTEEQQIQYKTCLVYITNNEFGLNIFDFGDRKTLSSGLLSVTILNCYTRWELFLCMLSVLFNTKNKTDYLTQFVTNELTISAQSNLINIVLDGDLFKLETPLYFTNHHKKLTVIIP